MLQVLDASVLLNAPTRLIVTCCFSFWIQNFRNSKHQLQDGYKETKPTFALGTCAGSYQPSEAMKQAMEAGGYLSSEFTFLHQDAAVLAEDFFNPLENLDPDDGKKVLACFGGQYSSNGE